MDSLENAYGTLLKQVDKWFAQCVKASPLSIACCQGCSSCCRGLFDITLLDAWYVRKGFDRLPFEVKEGVKRKSLKQIATLRTVWPEMTHPYILNTVQEREWDNLMPEDDETPCALLDDTGMCLIYDYRPMTCRLHGIPMVDVTGELLHDEWCTKNFINQNPLEMESLRWNFKECFRKELSLFQDLMGELVHCKINELDTFIPTALFIDFEGTDWQKWWSDFGPAILMKQAECSD